MKIFLKFYLLPFQLDFYFSFERNNIKINNKSINEYLCILFVIFLIPLFIGLYQVIKIENE